MKIKIIATHNGRFHTDEVFAIAILKLVYKNIKIIRTRDKEEFLKADLRVDVGRKYNYRTGDFDHHQNSFNKKRKNKIQYASSGLIWKHFGKKLVNSKKAFFYIDEKLIQGIDAMDNGVDIYEKSSLRGYTLGNVIDSYLPIWDEKNQDRDKAFFKALDFAIELLKREIKFANSIKKAEEILKNVISKSKNKDYIILEENIPWNEYVINNTKLKYIVEKNSSGFWSLYAVRVSLGSFENRKNLPKKWANLDGDNLVKETGVKDALFCHKNLFTAICKSKEGAVKLAELALKEK